jgi:nucleotide-binding universal stress UspA family protein
MVIKDILVHLDGEQVDGNSAAVAVALAKRFSARLTGLFARTETIPSALAAHRASDALLAAAERAKAAFEAAAAGVETRWWQVMHGNARDLVGEVTFCCHYADLVVMGQPGSHGPDDLADRVILHSGRPVLVVPADGRFEAIGRRVMVGWRSGKEAARALHDALPLMQGAEKIILATVGKHGGISDSQPRVDVVDHLRAHGLPVSGERIQTEGLEVMDALLSSAYDRDADLLVMGAHTGSGLSHARSGAGTRHVLAHTRVPVLFSH